MPGRDPRFRQRRAFDFIGIGVAVAFHEGSTLLVVIDALRLLADRAPSRQR